MPDVRIDVYADTHGAPKQLGDTERALDGIEKGAGAASTASGGLWKQFAFGQIAVNALKKALDLLKGVVEDSIKNALGQEKAENDLKAALEITGRTVEGNLQHYLAFAAAQMKVTTYTDDEIEASQALLIQLTSLNQQGIDRATKGAMGLATTMGMDLHGATVMVTKAMEGNFGALGRVGIKVAENLTAEQKQASLLEQLEQLYKRSTAETDTFGGALKQLKNSWGEALETAGTAIIKNETLQKAIKDLKEWVDKLASSPDFQLWLNTVIDGMVKAAEVTGKFAKGCRDLMMNVFGATKADKEMTEAQIKLNAALDRARAAGHDVDQVTRAIAAAAAAATPKINETGTAVHGLTAEQIKAAAEAKKTGDALAKSAQEIINKYNPLKAAMTAVFNEQKVLTAAWKAGVISTAEYKIGMDASTKSLRAFGDTITTAILPKAANMQDVFAKAVSKMQQGPTWVTKSWVQNATQWVQANQQAFSKILGMASTVIGQIDAIMQQSTTNKMLMLDQEYQKRLELINNSKMNEEEKEKAITALEAEYNMKRRAAEVQSAKQRKAIAIAMAIINIAEGVTKALSSLPPPFNIALAAITAAAGAIQIALIKSQPIGAAKGAIFKKPAYLMSQATGQEYEVAEGGEAEIVSSPRQLREAIMGPGGAAGQPITIENHIYLDGREMKVFISKTIRELSRTEQLLFHPRGIRAY